MPSNSPASGRVAGVRKPVVLAVGLAFGLALGSFGIAAAAPSSISTKALAQIKVCVTKSNGKIRYLKQSMDDCNDNEILLRWDTRAGEDGKDGQDGKNGINGKDGLPGAIGATGPAGSSGSAGSAGTAGVDGRTILSGAVAPASGTGANGDFYLNTATSMLYGPKASGAWPAGVSLVGTAGTAGSAGADGRTILSGAVAPASGTGANGDFYLNTATSMLYGPKASGAWPAGVSLIGAAGPSSIPGYTRVAMQANLQGAGGVGTDNAECPSGTKVLGGGFGFNNGGSDYTGGVVVQSRPRSDFTAWQVLSTDTVATDPAHHIQVYAICATTP